MSKKKPVSEPQKKECRRRPFSDLKGFAVSAAEQEPEDKTTSTTAGSESAGGTFAEEMALLGVAQFNPADELSPGPAAQSAVQREEAEFLRAMGELQVSFSDRLPAEDEPPTASARRLKQLRQGRLVPEATLDLHGLKRADVAGKLQFFLQDSVRQGNRTLLVVTGRGLHSVDGEPVLRTEAERYLAAEGRKWVAEWGRAPKQYGGAGALVLFLRRQPR